MRTFLIVALTLLGLALVAIGIVYFVEPAKHLPSFLPGSATHGHKHGVKHGIVALGLGVLSLLGALLVTLRPRMEGDAR